MKREAPEEDEEAEHAEQNGSAKRARSEPADDDDDDDLDAPVGGGGHRGGGVRKGYECPYLDTISRQNLDFDFEKCCSVSLSPVNVYACLVCGKYFQGRGPNTHAFTHALESGHHMFMKLQDGKARNYCLKARNGCRDTSHKVYCLPDGYEVVERSLDDIRYVLDPTFTPAEVARLDRDVGWARALDGTEYMPGLVGLNNMKANDYANVVIQALARTLPLRNFFLVPANYASCRSQLVQRFGELMRKLWNPRNFKGQVSPHEFMQAVMAASNKRYIIDRQSDPVEFASWLLNVLHADLVGGKRKRPSIVTRCFQGELEVTTLAGTGKAATPDPATGQLRDVVERVPFLSLGLDLPPAPLYKDVMEKNIIPQVPIFEILKKYDGVRIHDDIKNGRRRYRLTRLPKYMVLHMRRFTKNNFFVEKNPTIVNFPVKNLKLQDIVPVPTGSAGAGEATSKYDLVANLCHDGKAGEGTYKVHIHRKKEELWYEVQDLRVIEYLPQMVVLSETYFQVWQHQGH